MASRNYLASVLVDRCNSAGKIHRGISEKAL